jgi:CheY-like chemotaxis protein
MLPRHDSDPSLLGMDVARVLLVEDSAGDVLLTQQILAEAAVPVRLHIARDGLQGLMMMSEIDSALIILDLSLPVLSGFDVLERNPRKHVPVVVFSASVRQADRDRAHFLGAKEFITKPMDMVGYRAAVLGMIYRWTLRRRDVSGASA